jgi:hypothetical protein
MPKFIKLKHTNTYLNIDKILAIVHKEPQLGRPVSGTAVYFGYGEKDFWWVFETPEELIKLIEESNGKTGD